MDNMEPAISSSHPTSSPPRTSMNCEHVLMTSSIFLFFLALARYFSRSASGFAISAVVLVYYMAMIHLELLRQQRRRGQVMWLVMILATWIMFMSLSISVLFFQPDPRDWGNIVVFAFLCVPVAIILLNYRYMGREDAKSKDASDLV